MTFRELKEQINELPIPDNATIQYIDVTCYEDAQIIARYDKNMDEWIIEDNQLKLPESSEETDTEELGW